MWPGPSSRKFGAIGGKGLNDGLGQGNKIAIFDDAIDGAAALFDLFDRAYTGRTLRKAITKWSGGNWVQSYLDVFQSKAGIGPDEIITKDKLRDTDFALRFAKAMAWHEAGKEYPLDDAAWLLGHQEAFSTIPSAAQIRVAEEGKDAVTKTVKESVTLRSALATALGVIIIALQKAVEFAAAAAEATTTLEPIKVVAASVGANVPALGYGIAVGGIVMVIARLLGDASIGKKTP